MQNICNWDNNIAYLNHCKLSSYVVLSKYTTRYTYTAQYSITSELAFNIAQKKYKNSTLDDR